MPRGVVDWLMSAIQAGTARDVEVNFFGPVAAFPFDAGEGHFRAAADVDDVTLEFVPSWPRGEELDGTVEFVNAGFAATANGRILGNRAEDFSVTIPELRDAVLTVAGRTQGPFEDVLTFLKTAPLIATLGRLLLREDRNFHTIQTIETAVRQFNGAPDGVPILVAAARYLAAHAPTVRAQGQTYRIAQRLYRGENVFEEEACPPS